jgi:hypothetical protein
MKEKMELLTNFSFFSIPTIEMLHKEIQRLAIFLSRARKQGSKFFFLKEMPLVPVKHHFSYHSLH